MLTEEAARRKVLSVLGPLGREEVPLIQSLDRFAADQVLATCALPAFDNSQVDGYAVRAADALPGALLKVIGEQRAGSDHSLTLDQGKAVRIFTGAPIPPGCDAVVMQEDVTRDSDQITLQESVGAGEYIRRQGSDLCLGQIILNPGDLMTPSLVGVLASQGITNVSVHRRPRIAVLGTGDEVVPAGQPLQSGQIFNSNGPMLAALLAQMGMAQVTTHHCRDDLGETTNILRHLSTLNDVIIISGGVSVGDHDHVKPALQELGLAPDLWRVKVKPGKPFLFAHRTQPHHLSVFGLPGNPVSAFVTFHLFVRPALRRMLGCQGDVFELLTVRTGMELSNDGDRPHYLRGRLIHGLFQPVGLQQSHALHGLSRCSVLLRVPEHTVLPVGSEAVALLV